jgi:5-(carboxyamino)imidazole ribonucleotide synthase
VKIGILGGGQLGRMLALAGFPLGFRFRFLDRAVSPSASELGEMVHADFNDFNALARFAGGLDVVTYEFENVPVAAAEFLAAKLPVHPPPRALGIAQDRCAEKRFFDALGIAATETVPIESRAELDAALARVGTPAVLKTRRLGYDGKGQYTIRSADDRDAAWDALGGVPLALEAHVPFRRELSVIGVRGGDGSVACYPLIENVHEAGILRSSRAPAPDVPPALQALAERALTAALTELDYVGVLAIEFFEHEGTLLANEMAPRVHNSGHWTIEGARTSQFENHLRAVAGLPIGSTVAVGHSLMLNLIGTVPDLAKVLAIDGVNLHLYGKQSRAGRKLGHITLWSRDADRLDARLAELEPLLARS